MASKLRQTSARVSFFAFQDMITTVTGVLIIVMLMLSLEVTNRAESVPDPSVTDLQKNLQDARKKLAENLKALQQAEADVSALANRVFVLPKPDNSGKTPVLLVLSATNGICTRLGQTNLEDFKLGARGAGFDKVLASCNPSHDRLVFYVRPSGIAQFNACRIMATNRAFEIGYDAAMENRQYLLSP